MLEVLLLVLRQMRDIGHARHTHESGTRREATGTCETSQMLSLLLAKVAHTRKDLCLWISALRLPSSAVTVVAASLIAGRGLLRNAPFSCPEAGQAGERCGLRLRSCAA